uniref:Immunoglobulin V-set domain-containing protein n=1 Tax=Amphilophus citrinellus TaxID=61819 RepID=A0A3Q0QRY3_AMPCI
MWERYEPRKMVYVFCRESDKTEQHEDYRDRTEMNEDPLRTGNLSLTLKQPRQEDSGEYRFLPMSLSVFPHVVSNPSLYLVWSLPVLF